VSQGKLSIKQSGKWLPWRLRDIGAVPNPHVLFALLSEAKREYKVQARQSLAENPPANGAEHFHDEV
jgi:hypothetical protein